MTKKRHKKSADWEDNKPIGTIQKEKNTPRKGLMKSNLKRNKCQEQIGFDGMDFRPICDEEHLRRTIRKDLVKKYDLFFKKNKYVNGSVNVDEIERSKIVDASFTESSTIAAMAYCQWIKNITRSLDDREKKFGLTQKSISIVQNRLKEGFSPFEIVQAVIACTVDSFHISKKIDFFLAGIHSSKKLRQSLFMRSKQTGMMFNGISKLDQLKEMNAGIYRDPITGDKISETKRTERISALEDLDEYWEQKRLEHLFDETEE